jgi:hypothetical protein
MHCLKHLTHNGSRGYVTTWPSPKADTGDASATNLVTEANLQRLLNIPIYFFSGAENASYSPESTDISYTTLRRVGDEGLYDRDAFDGFGHLDCWMAEKAATVIWPRVREHMKKVSIAAAGSKTVPT